MVSAFPAAEQCTRLTRETEIETDRQWDWCMVIFFAKARDGRDDYRRGPSGDGGTGGRGAELKVGGRGGKGAGGRASTDI